MAPVTVVNGKVVVPAKRKADGEVLAVSKRGGKKVEEEEEEEVDVAVGVSRAEIKAAVEAYVRQNAVPATPLTDLSKDSPYPEVPGFPNAYYLFHLRQGGIASRKRTRALEEAKSYLFKFQPNLLGYQCNQNINFEPDFGAYLNISTNNIGDPFQKGLYNINTKFMERAVLDYYAELWHVQRPHAADQPESYWGFCLTMGSTEGNMYAMWNGRDYLSGKKILVDNTDKKVRKGGVTQKLRMPRLVYQSPVATEDNPNAYTPIAFYSEDTHYSLTKTMTMLDVTTFYAEGQAKYSGLCPLQDTDGAWPAEVPSLESGAVDVDALALLVEFFASRGYPILINFNYGTTFKGAYDDVAAACNKLRPILLKYDLLERKVQYDDSDPTKFDLRTGYWFHVDGALGAAYMPYVEMAFNNGLIDKKGPTFDFRLPMVHSIAMSGHKWVGAPTPCGVFMTRTKYQMLPPTTPEYIGSADTTFAGSRNALSPMLLWDYIARTSYEDQVYKSLRLEKLAAYAEEQLLKLQNEVVKEDIYVERTPLALTVRFKRPNSDICLKYTLSTEELDDRQYAHIFMMDHVTTELVDALVEDLSQPLAFADVTAIPFAPVTDASVLAPSTGRLAVIPTQGRGFR